MGTTTAKSVSFYHRETGLIHPYRLIVSNVEIIPLNTPPEHLAIEGHHDRLSKKVDVTTGEVVGYQPPAPDENHEWNPDTKRWQMSKAAQQRNEARAAAQARIAELERDVQPGLLRAVALGQDGAREKLQAVDAEIATLRSTVNVKQ